MGIPESPASRLGLHRFEATIASFARCKCLDFAKCSMVSRNASEFHEHQAGFAKHTQTHGPTHANTCAHGPPQAHTPADRVARTGPHTRTHAHTHTGQHGPTRINAQAHTHRPQQARRTAHGMGGVWVAQGKRRDGETVRVMRG